MISWLKGGVIDLANNSILINVNGVGYEVTPTAALVQRLEIGQDVEVQVFTYVREDALALFGFADKLEKQTFQLLTLVNGIGPKTACDILSQIDKVELLGAIGRKDITRIRKIKGVGEKMAQRMVIELTHHVGLLGAVDISKVVTGPARHSQDAIEALKRLGFGEREATKAIASAVEAQPAIVDPGDIVREALKFL